MERKLQYFSEPEFSPGTSPMGSRPGSPIMSDTEYEISGKSGKRASISDQKSNEAEQSWEWGQLPSSTTPSHKSAEKSSKSEKLKVKINNEEIENSKAKRKGWGISSYLFGGQTKKESNEEAPGVYLDDLKGDDEEMLKIYLGETRTRSNTISR